MKSNLRPHAEAGAISIALLGVISVLGTISLAVGLASEMRVIIAKAQTAADLGALAAANQLHNGTLPPCDVAELVVEKNGGRLVGCALDGENIEVSVAYWSGSDGHAVSVAGPSPE